MLLAFFVVSVRGMSVSDSVRLVKAEADSLLVLEQYTKALEAYIQTMAIADRAGDRHAYISSIGNIANIYAISGEYERSEHYIQRGYEAARKFGDLDLVGSYLINCVGIYSEMENAAEARHYLQLQEQYPVKDSLKRGFYLLYNKSVVAHVEKRYAEALHYNIEALRFAQSHGMAHKYVMAQYSEIGKNHLSLGHPEQALVHFKRMLHDADSLNSREQYASTCELMAKAYEQAGHADSAQFYKNMARTLRDSIFAPRQFSAAKEKLYQYENRKNDEQITSLSQQVLGQWVLIAVLLAIAAAAFWLLRRRYQKRHADAQAANQESTTPDTRGRIYLNDEQVKELARQVDEAMQDMDLITSPDFSLQMLSQRLGSNTKYVSYAINEIHQKNFKTLLNEVRIAEACRRLTNPAVFGSITIQGIYQDLGYNSAAAFIQAFKKIHGMTPSQYQKANASES